MKREDRPWEELTDLIAQSDRDSLQHFVASLDVVETVRAVARLPEEERARLLELVAPGDAAELIERIPESQAVEALEDVEPERAARILEELPKSEQADLIGELGDEEADAILAEMLPRDAQRLRELVSYPEGTAGSLMILELVQFRADMTVGRVMLELQRRADEYKSYDVQYGYVCDAGSRLVGVLPMRDLLLAPRGARVDELMIHDPISVASDATVTELDAAFAEHTLFGLPVVDPDGRLVGVVRRANVEEALSEESDDAFRRSQGIVQGDELRSMPLLVRARRRISWLSVNIGLNILAASVIAMNQDTLQSVIALAVFLPVISDMSGCSGGQAVAVSIREIALGVTRPLDWLHVLRKEVMLGVINGACLGVILGLVAWTWKGNPWLGLVVGGALALNTTISVSFGAVVPLALRALDKDPALASGPILTTITDTCGFFIVLTLASALLPMLTGG